MALPDLIVTPLGWTVSAVGLAALLAGRGWLAAALPVAAVLQGGSVLHVRIDGTFYGVPPYMALAALALFALALRCCGALRLPRNEQRPDIARWAWIYFGLAMGGSCVLPFVFAGVPVHALLNPAGFEAEPVPLRWGASHLVQAANAGVHALVLAYLLPQHREYAALLRRRLLAGTYAAIVLVVLLGVHERLALSGLVTSWAPQFMNNPTYNQAFGAEVGGVLRVSTPFSEPSYASAFLAAVVAGALAHVVWGARPARAVAVAAITALALANTLGTTGLFAAGGVALALLVSLASGICPRATEPLPSRARRLAWGLGASLALALVGAWLIEASPWSDRLAAVVERGLLLKLGGGETLSTLAREHSNAHAIEVMRQTAGLGAGLGSNRASSYFAALGSNVGLPGLLAFGMLIAGLLRAYWRADALASAQWFAFGALAGAVAAVAVGIPDLNLPWFWMLVFLAIVWVPGSREAPPPVPSDPRFSRVQP